MVCAMDRDALGCDTLVTQTMCELIKALWWATDGDPIRSVGADVWCACQWQILQV